MGLQISCATPVPLNTRRTAWKSNGDFYVSGRWFQLLTICRAGISGGSEPLKICGQSGFLFMLTWLGGQHCISVMLMWSGSSSVISRLEKHRELAKAVLRRKGILGGATLQQPKQASKRSVKFNKGYAALSQTADETLVSLESDSDGELESRGSSGYSSAEVNQDLNRQLLQDGYHLDEIPDDEDLDLIPPKPVASSCPCCFGESLPCTIQ
ncbi:protein FAM219B isoform X2 [Alligator sinensis]|uniref:Protein FAM219B isoform X2 n=1 Tax=Alligator sinensis TaxID=38654 RepID=A0A3Q0H2Q7_ALLSI|nr:protein FAM219B isoform X2 [Alligator sinensis]